MWQHSDLNFIWLNCRDKLSCSELNFLLGVNQAGHFLFKFLIAVLHFLASSVASITLVLTLANSMRASAALTSHTLYSSAIWALHFSVAPLRSSLHLFRYWLVLYLITSFSHSSILKTMLPFMRNYRECYAVIASYSRGNSLSVIWYFLTVSSSVLIFPSSFFLCWWTSV